MTNALGTFHRLGSSVVLTPAGPGIVLDIALSGQAAIDIGGKVAVFWLDQLEDCPQDGGLDLPHDTGDMNQ